MDIIKSIILEFGPCAVREVLDYICSDLFLQKGYYSPEEWTYSKTLYHMDKVSESDKRIFKFQCDSGYQVRYGSTKFNYYLLEEPRYLKVKGYLKRCMFCGMPIFVQGNNVFHFKYKCKQYKPQDNYKLLKVNDFWSIVSRNYIHGILDDLRSAKLRLLGRNQNSSESNVASELWLINNKARELELIESDRVLSLYAEEYIA
jgi:hypothetical protein